jgi:hypothetical protein
LAIGVVAARGEGAPAGLLFLLLLTTCCGVGASPDSDAARSDPRESDAQLVERYLSCVDVDCVATADALIEANSTVVGELLARLGKLDESAETTATRAQRIRIIGVLGRLDDARVEPALIHALESPDPLVRAAAIAGARDLRFDGWLDLVGARLEDPDPLVRETAIEAVASDGSDAAGRMLCRALRREQAPHLVAALCRMLSGLDTGRAGAEKSCRDARPECLGP